jgi:hypothetical protein
MRFEFELWLSVESDQGINALLKKTATALRRDSIQHLRWNWMKQGV